MRKRDWPGHDTESNWFAFAHGMLMILAWCVVSSVGIYASTHMRNSKRW